MLRRLIMAGSGIAPDGPVPTYVGNTSGTYGATGSASVPWPAHQAGDLGILVVHTSNQSPETPSGWTLVEQVGTGTPGVSGACMITLFSRVAASSSEPNVSVADSGNHTVCSMFVLRGMDPTTPIEATSSSSGVTGPTIALPAITTLGSNRLVVMLVADSYDDSVAARYSSWSNGTLTSITERVDVGFAPGTGGGLAYATGEKAVAGSTGSGVVSYDRGTHNYTAISLAVKPGPW